MPIALIVLSAFLMALATMDVLWWHSWHEQSGPIVDQETRQALNAQVFAALGLGASQLLLACPGPLVTIVITCVAITPLAAILIAVQPSSHRAAYLQAAGLLALPYAAVLIGASSFTASIGWALSLWVRTTAYALPFVAAGRILHLATPAMWKRNLSAVALVAALKVFEAEWGSGTLSAGELSSRLFAYDARTVATATLATALWVAVFVLGPRLGKWLATKVPLLAEGVRHVGK